jgi:hypothetical protein
MVDFKCIQLIYSYKNPVFNRSGDAASHSLLDKVAPAPCGAVRPRARTDGQTARDTGAPAVAPGVPASPGRRCRPGASCACRVVSAGRGPSNHEDEQKAPGGRAISPRRGAHASAAARIRARSGVGQVVAPESSSRGESVVRRGSTSRPCRMSFQTVPGGRALAPPARPGTAGLPPRAAVDTTGSCRGRARCSRT